jgi:hypothetical protein
LTDEQNNSTKHSEPIETASGKLPCQKPAFRFERVFETSALSCGKVQSTQTGCRSNRKTS